MSEVEVSTNKTTIEIDRERCMGSGNCLYWAPDSFDLGEDGRAVVTDPSATDEARLLITAEGCPVGAISLWHGTERFDNGGR